MPNETQCFRAYGQAPSQSGKADFACIHTCLDLAGLFVSSCPSEALEPFRVRFGQWGAHQQRRSPGILAAHQTSSMGGPSTLLDTSGVLCKSPQTANEAQRLRSLSVGLNPILGTECSCKTEGLLPLVTASHVLPSPDTPGSVGPAAAVLFCIQTHQATSCEVSSGTRCLWLGTQILSKLPWDQNGWVLRCRLSPFLRSSWGV